MLRRLVEQWAADGHDVTVVTRHWLASTSAFEEYPHLRIERLPLLRVRALGTVQFVLQLNAWMKHRRQLLDVVYVSMLKHAAFACVSQGLRLQIPVVLRAEGAGETGDVCWQEQARGGTWIRRECQKAAAIVAPSLPIQTELLASGYDPSRVHLIPNGVMIPERPWSREEAVDHRRNLQLPERPTVCFVGRLHPQKGVHDLIRACSLISEPVQLLIVGDGPCFHEWQALASRLNVSVIFTGQVEDVEPYLRASNLFVLPSYFEGLSVSLLEALALGIPALASDIEANANIVPADVLRLFPPHKPEQLALEIERQLQSPRTTQDLVGLQRQHIAEYYSISSVAVQHLRLFHKLQR